MFTRKDNLARHIRRTHPSVNIDAELAEIDTQYDLPDDQQCLEAVAEGKIDVVRQHHADQKFDISSLRTPDGKTALHLAAAKGDDGLVRLLCSPDFHTDVNATDRSGNLPLHDVGNAAVAHFLLQQDDTHVNDKNSSGMTPLHRAAARKGSLQILNCLLTNGARPCYDNWERSPLSYAAENGDCDMVAALVQCDDEAIPHDDNKGHPPSWHAAHRGHVNVLKMLCRFDRYWPRSSLHIAVKKGHIQAVKVLIDGRRLHSLGSSWYFEIALNMAAGYGHVEILQALVEAGADIDYCVKARRNSPAAKAPSNIGHSTSPLADPSESIAIAEMRQLTGQSMAEKGNSAVFRVTLKHTPLQSAVMNDKIGTLELLLKTKKVNVDRKDEFGRTPLSQARSYSVAELLLQTGKADVNSRDSNGHTPIFFAACRGDVDTVKLLLNFGADSGGVTQAFLQALELDDSAVVKALLESGRVMYAQSTVMAQRYCSGFVAADLGA
jgi:ankyrin repeat protein